MAGNEYVVFSGQMWNLNIIDYLPSKVFDLWRASLSDKWTCIPISSSQFTMKSCLVVKVDLRKGEGGETTCHIGQWAVTVMVMAITANSTSDLRQIPPVTCVHGCILCHCFYTLFITLTCMYLNHQPISAVGWYVVDIICLLNFLFLKPPFLFGVSAVVGGNLI